MYSKVRINLDSDLRKKFGIRSYPVTVGDVVKVRSGKRKGEGGKIIDVNHKNATVSIEGITVSKEDGKQKELFLRPADLVITRLDFSWHQRYDHLRKIAALRNITLSEEPPEQPLPEPESNEDLPAVESEASAADTSNEVQDVQDSDTSDEEMTESEDDEEPKEEMPEKGDVENDQ